MNGLNIIQVKAGTVIKDDDKELTVTDESAVQKGRTVYVTQKQYEAIKKASMTND